MRVLRYIALLWLATIVTGCLKDADFDRTKELATAADGSFTVEFTASQGATDQTVVATRALTADEENRLETVDVLVFDVTNRLSKHFLFATHGFDITNTAGSAAKTFKAMLRTTDDDTEESLVGRDIWIVVLANLRSEWNAIKSQVTTSTSPMKVLDELLTFSSTGAWNTTTDKRWLPMTGQTPVLKITKDSDDNLKLYTTADTPAPYTAPIQFVRSVASIDVGFGYGEGTTPQGLDNFKLKQVNLYGAPTSGFASGYEDLNGSSTPHIPADVEIATTPVEYTLETASATGMLNTVYTPEFQGEEDDCFLVIGGYYTAPDATENTSTLSWYKISWVSPDSPIQTYAGIRNWKYIVQIETINGPGYATPEEAAAGEYDSELLNLNIIPWDMSSTTATLESDYYFTVSDNDIVLSSDLRADKGLGDSTIELFTNYVDGWKVDEITYEGLSGVVVDYEDRWLATDITEGAAGQTTEMVILTLDNDDYDDVTRTGYIHLSAGRWKQTIKVTQLTTSDYTFSISPNYLVIGALGGSATAAITTNIPGKPTIYYSYGNGYGDWFTPSVSEDGKTLTVTAGANPYSSGRSGYLYFRVAGNDYYVNIYQAVPGVRAPKGVIGYYANGDRKGELTLDGDNGDNNDIVYVAYFKAGSLIALSSEKTNYDFNSGDIVAVPSEASGFPYTLDEYRRTITGTYSTAWNQIKDATDAGVSLAQGGNITQLLGDTYLADGLGDPCVHYFTDYRLPTSAENNLFVGGLAEGTTYQVYWKNWVPGGTDYNYYDKLFNSSGTYGSYYFYAQNSGNATNPGMGSFPVVANATDYPGVAAFSTALPAAGYRNYNDGSLYAQGASAQYLSSTTYSSSYVYNLLFNYQMVTPSYNDRSYYDYGYAVRCVSNLPSITVSPANYLFPALGGTQTFTVTTANLTEAMQVTQTAGTDSWLHVSLAGSTLTVTADENTSYSDLRTATITLTAGTATATVKVSQSRIAVGVLAPPGVIGYIKGTHTLTLKGSKEYHNATIDSDQDGTNDIEEYAIANFGGLENETVYAAYFKIGSLVAVGGDKDDDTIFSNMDFEVDDLIIGPTEYIDAGGWDALLLGLSSNPGAYNLIPGFRGSSSGNVSDPFYHNEDNFALGKGDPCMYYFGNKHGGGWKLPTGKPYNGYSTSGFTFTWYENEALGTGLPAGMIVETGVFYSATDRRDDSDGGFSLGSDGVYEDGYYVSSTAYNNKEYYLHVSGSFNSSLVFGDLAKNTYGHGYAVRCVRNE